MATLKVRGGAAASPVTSFHYLSTSYSQSVVPSYHPNFPKTHKQLSLSLQVPRCPPLPFHLHHNNRIHSISPSTMATGSVEEVLPPALDSSSDPPSIFDGTTRLYISYTCPYAQRVWITRNCKGLQDKIKLVPIDLQNRPAWYKERVYPANKVPSLEHNNEVRGESLDLIKYIDSHFEGPSLLSDDPAKKEFADELFAYSDSFNNAVRSSFKEEGLNKETGAAFDFIETALSKFEDGPFFLGQFSLVDIAYAPLIERFKPFLLDLKKYDITDGRPKLAAWIEEMNKIEAYKQTKSDPKELAEHYKKRLIPEGSEWHPVGKQVAYCMY